MRLPFERTDHEIFLLTSSAGGADNGQIATWIMPGTLAAERPRLVAVLSPRNYTWTFIRRSRRFAVHLLAEEQLDLLPRFGLQSGRDVEKFEGMEIRRTPSGMPLVPDCCGWMDCRVLSTLDAGDRVIVLAAVEDAALAGDRRPLRKADAFARLPEPTRALLLEKQRRDGERDLPLQRVFEEEIE